MTRWELYLPWATPPLSLNHRMQRPQENRVFGEVRRDAANLAREAKIPPQGRVVVELHWRPTSRVIWVDDENPVLTLKALCDGLVDAGVVADDDRWRMTKVMPVIHDSAPKGEPGVMWLVIETLPVIVDAPPPRAQPVKRPRKPSGSAGAPARRRRPATSSGSRSVGEPRVAQLADIVSTPPKPVRVATEWSARVAARAERTRRERG